MPVVNNIPRALTERPQWVVWRYEERDGKPTKPLYRADNPARHAKVSDPSTWCAFEVALEQVERGTAEGLGYVFTDDDGFVGVDIDKCADDEGVLNNVATDITKRLSSYAEFSPSGKGVHIFVQGSLKGLKGRRNDKIGVEIYTSGRYFTVTGERIPDTPRNIRARQGELEAVHELYVAKKDAPKQVVKPTVTAQPLNLSTDERLSKMFEREPKTVTLYNGDTGVFGDDNSAADQSLCNYLAWWLNYDVAAIDEAFRKSGLMRPKWDKVHSSEGETYGQMTITTACEGKSPGDGYTGVNSNPKPVFTVVDHTPNDLTYYPYTDLGNAQRLVAMFGESIRYTQTHGWLMWDGKRWVYNAELHVMQLAKQTIRHGYEHADGNKDLQDHYRKSESRTKLSSMIDLARSEFEILTGIEVFDTHKYLWNCPNCVLDLRTGETQPHNKHLYLTQMGAVNYEPGLVPELWLYFQNKINQGDDELLAFKQAMFGYALTGDISEQKFFMAHGQGANGKSTELETVADIMGDYSLRTSFDTFLQKPNDTSRQDIAQMRGKRLVVASEGKQNENLNESLVKSVTGGEKIIGRFLYKEPHEITPEFKIISATNFLPRVLSQGTGVWRRFAILPYRHNFELDTERDKNFGDKLRQEDVAIFSWLVHGARKWFASGLPTSAAIDEAIKDYKEDSDRLGDFISEWCAHDPNNFMLTRDLYAMYLDWADQARERHPVKRPTFKTMLEERGFRRHKRNNGHGYLGLKRLPVMFMFK
ncbi:MAG: phage/plasmid primase, P4 family [Deinococcota bacterium]